MALSERSDIAPFWVMEVMRAAEDRERSGARVLHLEVGQPSTGAPKQAIEAAHHSLDHHRLGYTGAAGLPELRQRIAEWYRYRHGVDIDPRRVVVTTGASGSCVLAFLALFDPGARVGVLEPGYPCYRNDLAAFDVEPVPITVDHSSGFVPTLDRLDRAGPLQGLVLASPSNPTGTVMGATVLSTVVEWAEANRVTLVMDEIYHGITYDAPAPSALNFSQRSVVFNSFSKYFSMTGWRLGWIVAPVEVAERIERLAQSLTISAPTISQMAALAAFDAVDELDGHVERYRRNRRVVLDGLAAAGLGPVAPADGAFYAWVDVTDLTRRLACDSTALCARWLDELSVAVTPGIDFDRSAGDRFLRLSYAGATEDMEAAMSRIVDWMENNG